jgi:hypothetical protein
VKWLNRTSNMWECVNTCPLSYPKVNNLTRECVKSCEEVNMSQLVTGNLCIKECGEGYITLSPTMCDVMCTGGY